MRYLNVFKDSCERQGNVDGKRIVDREDKKNQEGIRDGTVRKSSREVEWKEQWDVVEGCSDGRPSSALHGSEC